MKVAINLEPRTGPYGGGNSFLEIFVESLRNSGCEVFFDLSVRELDFIFLIDPRWRHPLAKFTPATVMRYILTNKNTLIVHRINECDERKNTSNMNRKLRLANYLADSTVFVSSWLKQLDLVDLNESRSRFQTDVVIRNGSDKRIFYSNEKNIWTNDKKLKIITHHWSSNPMKGLEVYQRLDDLLSNPLYSERFEFTYIGNVPRESHFVNTVVKSPLYGNSLANELRQHHIYITGSKNEPGGNHQNEGALCGLPIIYLESGSMSEYCEGFGIGIRNPDELPLALENMIKRYGRLRTQLNHFPNTAEAMVSNYISHLRVLEEKRKAIVAQRMLFRDPKKLARLLFPL